MGPNPKLFRELNVPYESREALDAALDGFAADVEAAREKHRIPNTYVILGFSVVQDGEEIESMSALAFGDSLRRLPLTAWAYGREQHDHETLIGRVIKAAKRA